MATSTQYNPQIDLNKRLLEAGASKTVYALTSNEIEAAKRQVFGNDGDPTSESYFEMFTEAWTAKQDDLHKEFFETWFEWADPVVRVDRTIFPFAYPTAGASEPIRHLIYDYAAKIDREGVFRPGIHVFKGEYEGYKAMAEAAGLHFYEHDRADWRTIADTIDRDHLFFLSQPSAIDGNVWEDFNGFLSIMSHFNRKMVVDLTYVGAIPDMTLEMQKINVNQDCVTNIVFSLSKPFGAYYDRIGGCLSREEDLGLFGNKWFKNLTSIKIGTTLMKDYHVFHMAAMYGRAQLSATEKVSLELGYDLEPSHVYMLATGQPKDDAMSIYLTRAGKLRVCLTPGMVKDTRGYR